MCGESSLFCIQNMRKLLVYHIDMCVSVCYNHSTIVLKEMEWSKHE